MVVVSNPKIPFTSVLIPNIISFSANRYGDRITTILWNGRSKPDTTFRATLGHKWNSASIFYFWYNYTFDNSTA